MTIKAILRRAKIETEKEIKIGNFYMNVEERTATIDGEEIIKLSEELLNEIKE
jgi:DNA-binding response OmpR family regulator